MVKMNIQTVAKNLINKSYVDHGFDIGTVIAFYSQGEGQQYQTRIYSAVNQKNIDGYKPGLSTISGACRILSNIIDIIANLGSMLLMDQSPMKSFRYITNNTYMILRGAVELVPVAGNLTLFVIDQIRIKIIERQVQKENIGISMKNFDNKNDALEQYNAYKEYINGNIVSSRSWSTY